MREKLRPAGAERRAMLGLAGAANLAASLAMAFVLAGATPAGGSPAERLAYIASHRREVVLGWGSWILATLGLLASLWVLAGLSAPRQRGWARLGLLFAGVGAALDLAADVIHMTVMPALAAAFASALPGEREAILFSFSTWDALAVALTGGAGNSLYALAGAMINLGLQRNPRVPRPFVAWGWAVWVAAAFASAALFWWPSLLPPAVGLTMGLYVSWMFGGALCLKFGGAPCLEEGAGQPRKAGSG